MVAMPSPISNHVLIERLASGLEQIRTHSYGLAQEVAAATKSIRQITSDIAAIKRDHANLTAQVGQMQADLRNTDSRVADIQEGTDGRADV